MQFNGYETYDFLNPLLALETFKQNPSLYDLVLLDIRMPELDGKILYKEMKDINANCKIYVFTGMEADTAEFLKICPSFREQQLIRKPIGVRSLLKSVNEALGQTDVKNQLSQNPALS